MFLIMNKVYEYGRVIAWCVHFLAFFLVLGIYSQYKTSKKYLKLSESRKQKYEVAWNKLENLWFCKIDSLTTFDLQNAVDSNADRLEKFLGERHHPVVVLI